MNKWYLYNPEFVLENEMHKLLWDFNIQTSPNLGLMTRPRDSLQKKRTSQIVEFFVTVDYR